MHFCKEKEKGNASLDQKNSSNTYKNAGCSSDWASKHLWKRRRKNRGTPNKYLMEWVRVFFLLLFFLRCIFTFWSWGKSLPPRPCLHGRNESPLFLAIAWKLDTRECTTFIRTHFIFFATKIQLNMFSQWSEKHIEFNEMNRFIDRLTIVTVWETFRMLQGVLRFATLITKAVQNNILFNLFLDMSNIHTC